MKYEIVSKLDLLAYPYGEDCANEWFSENTKFNLVIGKPVLYKHGLTAYKGAVGEVLGYRKTSLGIVAEIGLYETQILDKIKNGYNKGALFGSSGAEQGSFKVSPDGEVLEWNDLEITLIDVVSSGSLVPCNFRAKATDMANLKCNCAGTTMLMDVPVELVETIGEIMADNVAEEDVLDDNEGNTDDGNDNEGTVDSKKSAAAKKEEEVEEEEEEETTSVFVKRAAAVKKKSAEHKDVDEYLSTLVASEIISEADVEKHRNVFVSLKSANNDEAIQTYMDTLESGATTTKAAPKQKVKAAIHKTALNTGKKTVDKSAYDVEVQNLATALETFNSYTQS